MMPNIDPRTLKSMMAKMGIKSTEIDARSVVIDCQDRQIVITNPQVTQIEAQGTLSFQVAGNVEEHAKGDEHAEPEITEDDIKLVMEKTGESDAAKVKEALERNNGDIAAAILELGGHD
ncbi:MAG: nascent polypeptide-associated complex protein [Candidatus Marsarchaeota archaeon]|jgi:nascent polypeptide-associated complex subunit alpha|nr:nascent polypeptide-associated complex protein [Candidatus Marsarchaeota archaeon]